MRRVAEIWWIPAALVAVVAAGTMLARRGSPVRPAEPVSQPTASAPATEPALVPKRIISLGPNITETLFALGLGDHVVGVTRFCHYPPEAEAKPRVGGLLDPNYEAIVGLRPDVVICFTEHVQPRNRFAELGLATLVVPHRTIGEVFQCINEIGGRCGRTEQARALVERLQGDLAAIRRRTESLPRPSVMLVVDRNIQTERIQDAWIVGKDDFYDVLIDWAGGRNAYTEAVPAFPKVSGEGVLRLNPDVIIELAANPEAADPAGRDRLAQWRQLEQVTAVKTGRVYLLNEGYAVIPGPRVGLLLAKLVSLIHPELERR